MLPVFGYLRKFIWIPHSLSILFVGVSGIPLQPASMGPCCVSYDFCYMWVMSKGRGKKIETSHTKEREEERWNCRNYWSISFPLLRLPRIFSSSFSLLLLCFKITVSYFHCFMPFPCVISLPHNNVYFFSRRVYAIARGRFSLPRNTVSSSEDA